MQMTSHHLVTYLKGKVKQISLELCTNRKIDICKVKEIAPPFCSVTWLDNQVTNFKEHPAVKLSYELVKNNINVLIHLPGRIYDRNEMLQILAIIKDIGVRNILAIQGEKSLGKSKTDFPYAYNLVEFIKQNFNDYFCIGVAGYPAGRPKDPNLKQDLLYLKRKVDVGANFIITQAIFDINTFCTFHKNCRELGINVPIFPGLFIIYSYSSLMKMVKFCKLHLPEDIMKLMEDHKDNNEILQQHGISLVENVIQNLFDKDDISVCCVHVFTLNNLDTTKKVVEKFTN